MINRLIIYMGILLNIAIYICSAFMLKGIVNDYKIQQDQLFERIENTSLSIQGANGKAQERYALEASREKGMVGNHFMVPLMLKYMNNPRSFVLLVSNINTTTKSFTKPEMREYLIYLSSKQYIGINITLGNVVEKLQVSHEKKKEKMIEICLHIQNTMKNMSYARYPMKEVEEKLFQSVSKAFKDVIVANATAAEVDQIKHALLAEYFVTRLCGDPLEMSSRG